MIKSLQTQSFMRNPDPVLKELRQQGPLVRSRIPILGKVWLTTNQAAALRVLKDAETFTVRKADGRTIGLSWWMPRRIKLLASNMLASDDPDHRRLRGLVDQAFQRREIFSLESEIRQIAHEFSGKMGPPNDGFDLVEAFARPFPLAVICALLGLPKEDQAKFMQWAGGLTRVAGLISFLWVIFKLEPMIDYVEEQVAEAKLAPSDGLLGELVRLQDAGHVVSDDELIAMVFLLLMAGHETTTHLISGSVLAFLQNPQELEKLQSDNSLIDLAIEECLRFVSPVQSTKPRFVQKDCEVEGVQLKRGDVVMPLLIAANHDPDVFESPEKFDISRKPNRHIEFGTGVHFCLGHQLARLEIREALRTLLLEGPGLQLAVSEEELVWNERFGLRSLKTLPVVRRHH